MHKDDVCRRRIIKSIELNVSVENENRSRFFFTLEFSWNLNFARLYIYIFFFFATFPQYNLLNNFFKRVKKFRGREATNN